MLKRFLIQAGDDERGATAIEYALIAGTLALSIVAVLSAICQNLSGIFTNVAAGFH